MKLFYFEIECKQSLGVLEMQTFFRRHESGLASSFEEKLTLDDIQTDQIKLNAVGRKIEDTRPVFQDILNKGEHGIFMSTLGHPSRGAVKSHNDIKRPCNKSASWKKLVQAFS